jgi:FdrA protein
MKAVESLSGKKMRAINIGLSSFADDLEAQGVQVTRVDWKPPAGGDERMLKLLKRLGS